MSLSVVFAGFRHAHINDLHRRVLEHSDLELVASCETDADTRESLSGHASINITHSDFSAMLDEVDCDIVAIGDYYGNRGALAIEALSRGKHVIADKPLCTSIVELEQIEALHQQTGLAVGCMLDMRNTGSLIRLRELVQGGEIGRVVAVSYGGQHPLMYGKRPGWYFEPGKHGGTINDIAIHAIDAIPWIVGQPFKTINAARNWNAALPEVPHFRDSAQLMMTLADGCGVLGDVSYLAPDSFGYSFELYWRMSLWGTGGVLETAYNAGGITVFKNGEKEKRVEAPADADPGGYLRAFLNDIAGQSIEGELDSAAVLTASRWSMQAQAVADGTP